MHLSKAAFEVLSYVPEGRRLQNYVCMTLIPFFALKGGRWQQRESFPGWQEWYQRLVFPYLCVVQVMKYLDRKIHSVRRGRNLEPLNFTGLDRGFKSFGLPV